MQDVPAGAGRAEERAGAIDGGDLSLAGAGFEVSKRVRAAGAPQRSLASFDLVAVLGVKRDTQIGIARDLKGAAQAVIVRTSQVACSRAHEHLQAHDQTRVREFVQGIDVLADQTEDPEVADRGALSKR